MEYILLYPETHARLGLFRDLDEIENVKQFVVGLKKVDNKFFHFIQRVYTSGTVNKHISLPLKSKWYTSPEIVLDSDKKYCVIVIDGALNGFEPATLNKLFALDNVRGVLVLLNSLDASSVVIIELKDKFKKVNWDSIYTYDPCDSKKFGFKNLGFCYYSMHDINEIHNIYPDEPKSLVYFTGWLKGGRDNMLLEIFKKLNDYNIKMNFNFALPRGERNNEKLYADQINYYNDWMPYDRVLAGVYQSEVILEVLQEGQSGPSLRYYEAVCYNKKLLTNNPAIVDFPYYNKKFMRIIDKPEDIDIEWIKEKGLINYNYRDEFSPVYMLDIVCF